MTLLLWATPELVGMVIYNATAIYFYQGEEIFDYLLHRSIMISKFLIFVNCFESIRPKNLLFATLLLKLLFLAPKVSPSKMNALTVERRTYLHQPNPSLSIIIFLVGTTWTEKILACLLEGVAVASTIDVEARFPFLDFTQPEHPDCPAYDGLQLAQTQARPRFIKSHLPASLLPDILSKGKYDFDL